MSSSRTQGRWDRPRGRTAAPLTRARRGHPPRAPRVLIVAAAPASAGSP